MKTLSLIERHPKLFWLLHDLSKQNEKETINDLKQVFLYSKAQLNLVKQYKSEKNKNNGLTDWQKRKRNLPFVCEGKFHMRGYKI